MEINEAKLLRIAAIKEIEERMQQLRNKTSKPYRMLEKKLAKLNSPKVLEALEHGS